MVQHEERLDRLSPQLVLDADRTGLEVPILAEVHLVRREAAGGGSEHLIAGVRQRARLPLVSLREARVRVVVGGQRVDGWDLERERMRSTGDGAGVLLHFGVEFAVDERADEGVAAVVAGVQEMGVDAVQRAMERVLQRDVAVLAVHVALEQVLVEGSRGFGEAELLLQHQPGQSSELGEGTLSYSSIHPLIH